MGGKIRGSTGSSRHLSFGGILAMVKDISELDWEFESGKNTKKSQALEEKAEVRC